MNDQEMTGSIESANEANNMQVLTKSDLNQLWRTAQRTAREATVGDDHKISTLPALGFDDGYDDTCIKGLPENYVVPLDEVQLSVIVHNLIWVGEWKVDGFGEPGIDWPAKDVARMVNSPDGVIAEFNETFDSWVEDLEESIRNSEAENL